MTREPFKGTINVDIRDSVPDWSWRFTGGTIRPVAVDVSGNPYVDMAREAEAMLVRE
jgi:hypothetical protein